MTDLEISKALALAIGWKRVLPNEETAALKQCWVLQNGTWRMFDYRDEVVAFRIAQRYDCFPIKATNPKKGEWLTEIGEFIYTDTPQKAIALAVIEGAKT